jgi:hypothetical protein
MYAGDVPFVLELGGLAGSLLEMRVLLFIHSKEVRRGEDSGLDALDSGGGLVRETYHSSKRLKSSSSSDVFKSPHRDETTKRPWP